MKARVKVKEKEKVSQATFKEACTLFEQEMYDHKLKEKEEKKKGEYEMKYRFEHHSSRTYDMPKRDTSIEDIEYQLNILEEVTGATAMEANLDEQDDNDPAGETSTLTKQNVKVHRNTEAPHQVTSPSRKHI